MIKFHHKHCLSKTASVILSFIWLSLTNVAIAGICDITGGSGIGGTGAPMNGSGVGGTGQVAHGNGIGGTGKPIKKKGNGIDGRSFVINGSGIGGTGQPIEKAGVIIGTITGFGSICINGIEIHYTSSTPLHLNGQTVNPESSLAIGQVVAVAISGLGNEVIANNMHIIHAANGPVSSIDLVKGELVVLGQTVQLPLNTKHANSMDTIQTGDYVEVSGLRNPAGNIIASRIDEVAPRPTVSLYGSISSTTDNSFNIQGIKINTPLPLGLSVGQEIHVSGQLDISGLNPDSVMLGQDRQLVADVGGLISIEGYVESSRTLSTVEIAGRTIEIPASLQEETGEIPDHQKVIVTGRLIENDVIQMEHILIGKPHVKEHEDLEQFEQEESEFEAGDESEHKAPEAPEHDTPE
ncbi:MAG: DUF5666 domain-containing protein, partial [Methylophagaceae bacterium]